MDTGTNLLPHHQRLKVCLLNLHYYLVSSNIIFALVSNIHIYFLYVAMLLV